MSKFACEPPPFMLPAEPVKRSKVTLPENTVQRALFAHIRRRGVPGLFAFHPKNGGIHQRGRRAGINTGMGVVPGVPDVILIHNSKCYAIELKTERGKLSDEQSKTISNMMVAGAQCAVAFGLDDALARLESWGLMKGSARGSGA
ncbi:MAG: VRR-NUC domain-containing protein [Alphaproteobacteria bacterium]|nr:VRR-NUC domain-containing protein [Alphaproteobacteria bacterium]